MTPDTARAYRGMLRLATLDKDTDDARRLVLRTLHVSTGTGSLPDTAGMRELERLGHLVRLASGEYRLSVPNPNRSANGDAAPPGMPLDAQAIKAERARRKREGVTGPMGDIEYIEARRPLYAMGRAA